ncbi:hypothetical protein HH310_33455 [Actinoplanes sp. TBRC 11911]|uniref:hypothetical protein n=1 Tax=Actinoplanes sp. TBRC 11911 TaxID=2729386 RepID=UPI00145C971D|nr:hypothetical protein [Actinoplanes sp. TBRC 11911]NMO56073.1 hypothetical protein [Actinoplanes sp. TBRC 11911]
MLLLPIDRPLEAKTLSKQPGAGWEFESDYWKRPWGGAKDASLADAVLGESEKFRALIQLFVDQPSLRATRDQLVKSLKTTSPGLGMSPRSVTGCRNKLGWNAFYVAQKRLNPISADKSGGPNAVWFMRPEAHAAFALVM